MAGLRKHRGWMAIVAVGITVTWVGAMSVAAGEDKAEYVGSAKCKMCHSKEYKSWEETTMGKAMESLKPGGASEARTKHNLETDKDYTTDESCLACHTTGFGQGGYALAADEKEAKKMEKSFGAVGCESCHGPGGKYIELHEKIKKEKTTYKVEDMYAAGMTKIDEGTCKTCHNEKSPTFAGEFKYDPANRTGMHEIFELKQREQ